MPQTPKGLGTIFRQAPADPTQPAPSSLDEPSHVELEAPSVPPAEPSSRYRLRRTIGEGGMGVVSLVHDRVVGRNVALKQLKSRGRRRDQEIARFEREARLQGQLEHPAIVPVYDIGATPEGVPFFTMKRVRGEPLEAILERLQAGDEPTRHRWSRRKLLGAFSQLCLAAHYAHERGVVHRDVKPANVMLGNYGEVYLLDWGVAKVGEHTFEPDEVGDEAPSGSGVHTARGMVVGTVRSMAPEQAEGRPVDARTDVYALGTILFEILTLHPLHAGIDASSLEKITSGVESRPSVVYPELEIPPELEVICVAATRRDPAERTPSALAIHEAIEAYLDGDRDVALRRELAKKLASDAQKAVHESQEQTMSPEEEAVQRRRVVGDVSRALALDPHNADALRTLLQVLTQPPRHVPREVEDARHLATLKNLRRGGVGGALIYGYISLNALATYMLGVRDWPVFVTAHALWGAALAASIVTIVRPSYLALGSMFLFGAGASLWVTNVYGPFLLVPTFMTMHAILFALVRDRRLRVAFVVAICLLWTVSVAGEAGGLFYDTVTFTGDGISFHSPVLRLPEGSTTFYLYAAVLASIVIPAFVIGSLRSSYDSADEKMRMQAWQLKRMIPDEATARRLDVALD